MQLFEGYSKAYGVYTVSETRTDGKMVGARRVMREQVTKELWNDHLIGVQGIGIIPINENNQVRFAAIDIDKYDLNFPELIGAIEKEQIPVCVMRSKSGGAHVFMFFSEWVEAKLAQMKMREIAASLGFGDCEIFPKQFKIFVERGDIGQWLNMPYFNIENTTRYGFGINAEVLSCDDWVKFASGRCISLALLKALQLSPPPTLAEGPPCLQRLISIGFPRGTRNNGLTNLGVYAKKSNPDNWQQMVVEYNGKFMDPPLTDVEVSGVIKSLTRKDYAYMCHQQPIMSFCDSAKCRLMKYGIGYGFVGLPKLGSLTKVNIPDDPDWYVDVEGGTDRIGPLKTDELIEYAKFRQKCAAKLNILPGRMKDELWTAILQKLFEEVLITEVPEDLTKSGQLFLHFENFCVMRAQAKNHEEILLGKPWTSCGFHYFRMTDFMDYLDRCKFKLIEHQQVYMILRDKYDMYHQYEHFEKKSANVYRVAEFPKYEQRYEPPKFAEESF